jgi:hypothetical protein
MSSKKPCGNRVLTFACLFGKLQFMNEPARTTETQRRGEKAKTIGTDKK